jgi:hypothetical protein
MLRTLSSSRSDGLHKQNAVATWITETISEFALYTEEYNQNLCRDDMQQELPHACWPHRQ